jgi:hypothetical protein
VLFAEALHELEQAIRSAREERVGSTLLDQVAEYPADSESPGRSAEFMYLESGSSDIRSRYLLAGSNPA